MGETKQLDNTSDIKDINNTKDRNNTKDIIQNYIDQLNDIEILILKTAENQLDSSFKELITQADNLRDNEKWEEAINKYGMAAKIKTLDTYPKQQIDLINLKITQISRKYLNK